MVHTLQFGRTRAGLAQSMSGLLCLGSANSLKTSEYELHLTALLKSS